MYVCGGGTQRGGGERMEGQGLMFLDCWAAVYAMNSGVLVNV